MPGPHSHTGKISCLLKWFLLESCKLDLCLPMQSCFLLSRPSCKSGLAEDFWLWPRESWWVADHLPGHLWCCYLQDKYRFSSGTTQSYPRILHGGKGGFPICLLWALSHCPTPPRPCCLYKATRSFFLLCTRHAGSHGSKPVHCLTLFCFDLGLLLLKTGS